MCFSQSFGKRCTSETDWAAHLLNWLILAQIAIFGLAWESLPLLAEGETPSQGWPLLSKEVLITFARGKVGGKKPRFRTASSRQFWTYELHFS